MRVCEIQLCAALSEGRAWRGENTECDSEGTVRLHGNTIAINTPAGWRFNLCGWNTHTTCSRINAIRSMLGLPGLSTKNGTLFIVGSLGYTQPPKELSPAQRRAHTALHYGQRVEVPTNGWFE